MTEESYFQVGESYTNRQRQYTVIALHDGKLQVKFDDDSIGILDCEAQKRILENIARELTSLTQGNSSAGSGTTPELNQRFMSSIGFLAARAELQAEVPPQSVSSFENRYETIKGRAIHTNISGYFPLSGTNVNKWGPELRTYFKATSAELDELYFGESVSIKDGTQPNQYRINNNAFFYRLLSLGFDFGTSQNIDGIRQNITLSLRDYYNQGVQRGQ